MNNNQHRKAITGFAFGVAVLAAMTGCVVDGPRHVYVAPPVVQVDAGVVVQDDYVYYPAYQVYYSSNRHQYIYLEGRSWVTRPAPPRVSVDVLFRSPSVHVGFHDSPSFHHTEIVRQYPRRWAPPRSEHREEENRNRR